MPVPQGSMRLLKDKNGNAYMTSAAAGLKQWRNRIAMTLRKDCDANGVGILLGPIYAYLVFVLPRPKTVKRFRPWVRPDLDKLTRSVFDAATQSGAFRDDSQVCEIKAVKVYGEEPKLKLYLREME